MTLQRTSDHHFCASWAVGRWRRGSTSTEELCWRHFSLCPLGGKAWRLGFHGPLGCELPALKMRFQNPRQMADRTITLLAEAGEGWCVGTGRWGAGCQNATYRRETILYADLEHSLDQDWALRARTSEEEAGPVGHGQPGMLWNFCGLGGDPREV